MLDGIRVRIVEKIVNKSKNLTKFEDEATHSRDFSHELVATYIK